MVPVQPCAKYQWQGQQPHHSHHHASTPKAPVLVPPVVVPSGCSVDEILEGPRPLSCVYVLLNNVSDSIITQM